MGVDLHINYVYCIGFLFNEIIVPSQLMLKSLSSKTCSCNISDYITIHQTYIKMAIVWSDKKLNPMLGVSEAEKINYKIKCLDHVILSSSHRIEIYISWCKNFQAQAHYVINQVFIIIKSYDYSSQFTMHSHPNLKINYSVLFTATVKLSS